MKTLYLECNMGAAGDMLMAALLELHPDPTGFLARMNALGLPKITVSAAPAVQCGITGTHVSVLVGGQEEVSEDVSLAHGHDHEHHDHHEHDHDHEHHEHDHAHSHEHAHHSLADITHLLSHLALPETVREHVAAVYGLIAEAEAHAHSKPISEIHFHEVGSLDAVTDVVGVCWLIEELAPAQILASPVHVGAGHVRCAHGILPVPAPATAFLLRDVPTYGGTIQAELCTPTGAALLRHFVSTFGPQPVLRVQKIGYGMGSKTFEMANCVRALWGDTPQTQDAIVELCCNLDDMTPEAVGFATEELMQAGALDVYTTAVQMKKNRPGIVLTCMCRENRREALLQLLFRHTTTLGVRESRCNRYTLPRQERTVETPYGTVRIKGVVADGVMREKAEYEDLAAIARAQGLSLEQVRQLVRDAK